MRIRRGPAAVSLTNRHEKPLKKQICFFWEGAEEREGEPENLPDKYAMRGNSREDGARVHLDVAWTFLVDEGVFFFYGEEIL